jgi:hypothetical protein
MQVVIQKMQKEGVRSLDHLFDFDADKGVMDFSSEAKKKIEPLIEFIDISPTTMKYLEKFDQLEIEGNQGIKEAIRRNILATEKKFAASYRIMAKQMGISTNEFKQYLQEKVERMVRESYFFRATHIDILDRVLNIDGRFMSQFETQTSDGNLYPGYRADRELQNFGFNDIDYLNVSIVNLKQARVERNAEMRPIYGYFSDDIKGVINTFGKNPPSNSVITYGKVSIRFNEEKVIRRTTVSFNDSLWEGHPPPTPAMLPHFTSLFYNSSKGLYLDEVTRTSILNWGSTYTEAQYHCQLTVGDIEEIYISIDNNMDQSEIDEVRRIYKKFIENNPDSTIKLIEYKYIDNNMNEARKNEIKRRYTDYAKEHPESTILIIEQ